tara:strand:+ start:3561 stop:4142 length:582 start_codon:yes stop_codon:yes gene_type:complete
MNGLLSSLILFGSFAMRTPNDITIPKDDYEVSIGFKNDKVYFKRDWERELGEHYIDDEIWYEYKPENFYFKPQYINKTSRDLTYGKVDARYRKGDYSIGYTGLYSDDNLESGLSMGVSKKKEINHTLSLEVKWDGYYFSDQETGESRFDMEDYAKINYKINDKTTLTNIFDYNDVKGKKYYKFKVGIEYSFGE